MTIATIAKGVTVNVVTGVPYAKVEGGKIGVGGGSGGGFVEDVFDSGGEVAEFLGVVAVELAGSRLPGLRWRWWILELWDVQSVVGEVLLSLLWV